MDRLTPLVEIQPISARPALSVAVPALNEEEFLEKTVRDIVRAAELAHLAGIEIIIIDDGSTDATPKIADRLANEFNFVKVIHNGVNLGPGLSVRKSVAVATGRKYLIIAGDNDMAFELMVLLFRIHDQADLISCFFLNRELRGRRRTTLSILFNLIYTWTFNVFLTYLNGPCIYPLDLLKSLDFKSTRFSIAAEMTIKCMRRGATFMEVPSYMQTGPIQTTSVSWRNLAEAIRTYIVLVWEIKVAHRDEYRRRPTRLMPAFSLMNYPSS